MIPYLQAPHWQIAGITVQFFGLMVLCALSFGFWVVYWRARTSLVPRVQALEATMWVVLVSLVMSHVVAIIAYRPADFLRDPMLLLDVTGDMSNMGGMLGGIACILVFRRVYGWSRPQMLSFFDLITWGFVFGHFFGRLGCTFAHDHVGIPSQAFIAVRFPDGPRLDLGLIEWLWIDICIVAFLILSKRPRNPGFYTLLFLFAHGIVRFLLDFLRVGDERFFGLTPAQYACGALVGGVVWIAGRHRRAGTAHRPG